MALVLINALVTKTVCLRLGKTPLTDWIVWPLTFPEGCRESILVTSYLASINSRIVESEISMSFVYKAGLRGINTMKNTTE